MKLFFEDFENDFDEIVHDSYIDEVCQYIRETFPSIQKEEVLNAVSEVFRCYYVDFYNKVKERREVKYKSILLEDMDFIDYILGFKDSGFSAKVTKEAIKYCLWFF